MRLKGWLIALATVFSVAGAWGAGESCTVNVRDFGAVGDGVHDDTLALQKAADAVYPQGKPQNDSDLATLRTRYAVGWEAGPVKEVFFPKGTYRISGPVMFSYPVCLRGESGAVISNVAPDQVSFYFHYAFVLRVDDLSFAGGKTQVCVWNRNRAGPVILKNCTFRGAAGTAFWQDSLQWASKPLTVAMVGKRLPVCPPYEVSRLPDGRVALKDRKPGEAVRTYSSPLVLLDRCTFEDNAQAIKSYADGQIFRDCTIRVPQTAAGGAVDVAGGTQLKRVKLFVARNPAIEQHGFDVTDPTTVFSDCEIASDGDLEAVHSSGAMFRSTIITRVALRNVTLKTGRAPVFRFQAETLPNLVSVHGLKGVGDGRQPLFAFDKVPTVADFADWHKVNVKKALQKTQAFDFERAFGVVVEATDERRFDATLPPSLRRFRRTVPADVRCADPETFTPFDAEDWGAELTDPEIGSARFSRPNGTDDARLHDLFAKAVAGGSGTVVLPARWILLRRPIELAGKVRVTVRGRAVLTGVDDTAPLFRVREGADVVFENIVFCRGRNLLQADVPHGRVRFYGCDCSDQAEETIRSVVPGPSAMRIEVTGGNFISHAIYRGNANPMLFDATEVNPGTNHKGDGELREYRAFVNLAGGKLEIHDLLCSPMCLEYVPKSRIFLPATPDQIGDFRYFDNSGDLRVFEMRFGGEWGGLTPVYQFGSAASTYIEGGYSSNIGRRLRHHVAQVVADEPTAKVTLVELGERAFTNAPPAHASVLCRPDGSFAPLRSVKEWACYPFELPEETTR